MISIAQIEQHLFQLIQKYNKKNHTWPEISKKSNFKNYTKWCKEIQTEFDDRGQFNHIDCVFDYTPIAHELWTWIQTFLGPSLLPPVNNPIQREVARGRNVGDTDAKINLSISRAAPATTIVVATRAYNCSPF